MAAVAIAADNVRIAEGASTPDTGTWGNDGGGGGVSDEPDFYYQGTESQSRKISTSLIGRDYTHGSGTDMTATDRQHYIAKIQATNKDALLARTSPALLLKVGSASNAYHEYYVFGNDNYPKRGGWQILPINPAVIGYSSAVGDTGSPSNTGILYWSVMADYSSTSKSENTMIDAIDIGAGLHLTGGDGADTDGVFQDFLDADEGTAANSWGYVFSEGPFIFVTGRLSFGENVSETAVATVFNDSGKALSWTNGLVSTGFHKMRFNLGNASTDIDIDGCSFFSQGQIDNDGDRGYTTTEDSRPQFEVTGTSGALNVINSSFDNWSTFSLNASTVFTGNTLSGCDTVDLNGTNVDLDGTSLLASTVDADTSSVIWNSATDPDGFLDNMTISKGANAHHAIEFGLSSPLSITLRDIDFSGFNAADTNNDSTFHVLRTTGTVTINIVGGSGNVSYKSAGATVNVVQNPVTTKVTVRDENNDLLSSARVYLRASDGTGDLPFEETISATGSGTTITVTHTAHGLATNDWISIYGIYQDDYNGTYQITFSDVNTYTYTIGATVSSSPAIESRPTPIIESTTVTIEGNSVATVTFDMPATRPDNDLYVLFVSKDDQFGCSELNTVHGWTNIQQGDGPANEYVNGSAWYKVGSSEPASYTFDFDSADSETAIFVVYRISGADATTPINVSGINEQSPTLSPNAPTITTTEHECLIFAMCAGSDFLDSYPSQNLYTAQPDDSDWTPSVNHGSFEDGTAGACSIAISTKVQDTLGATGVANFTFSGNDTTEEHVGIQVAIAGAAAGPKATGVVINADTTGTGVVSDTRTWSNPQPVTGYIRKGTASPYYKQSALTGTVSTTAGLDIQIKMVRDD
jgi:hypothetical protein